MVNVEGSVAFALPTVKVSTARTGYDNAHGVGSSGY